jgi:hypothetical protein
MDVLSKIFSSLANAKFPGGVVGRNLLSGVGAGFALVALGFAGRGYPWVLVLLAVAIVAVYALASFQANKFADKYPQLVTLEGAPGGYYLVALLDLNERRGYLTTAFWDWVKELPTKHASKS